MRAILIIIILLTINNSFAQIFNKGKRYQGNGEIILKDGNLYIGFFSYQKKGLFPEIDSNTILRNGKGTTYFGHSTNVLLSGIFKNDTIEGEGIMFDSTGKNQYLGYFIKGELRGKIKHYHNSRIRYIGYMNSLKYDIEGVLFDSIGNIVYMGEFSNGLKSGKGKYWDNNKIQYSGDWKNNLPNGKGIEYHSNSFYEGDFVDGKKNGLGVLIAINSGQKYIGQFKNNLMDGMGILFRNDSTKLYEGYFLEAVYHGKGLLFYEDGKKFFEGEFTKGKAEGNCTQYHKNGNTAFQGAYKDSYKNGFGKAYYESGLILYEGGFLNDKYHGRGKLYASGYERNKLIYDGDFQNGLKHGFGTQYYSSGPLEYSGYFQGDKFSGKGIHYASLYDENYDKQGPKDYEGEFSDNKLNGLGVEYYANGKIKYKGDFIDGFYSGKGTLFSQKGSKIYEGEFKGGQRNGMGLSFLANGKIDKDGLWENDLLLKSKKQMEIEEIEAEKIRKREAIRTAETERRRYNSSSDNSNTSEKSAEMTLCASESGYDYVNYYKLFFYKGGIVAIEFQNGKVSAGRFTTSNGNVYVNISGFILVLEQSYGNNFIDRQGREWRPCW